jgi:FixJ family two-component response regulator
MARGKVYLVDDDPAVRKALNRLIAAAGYEVETFADAAAYLAAPSPEGAGCLVVDVRMPGMSGFDLQGWIAGTGRSLPVVFITGHGDEDVRAHALRSGAVDLLFKPVDEARLVAAIEKAFAATVA